MDPAAELREEQIVGHCDAQLTALHRLGPFVCRFELRVHPLVPKESRTILCDAVSAHQAYRFAHHTRAVTCVPKLASWTQHVSNGVEESELYQRVFFRRVGQASLPAVFRSVAVQKFDRTLT